MIEEMVRACYANRLRAGARAISKLYDAELKPLDLKISQLSVLTAVGAGEGKLSIVEIATLLAMDRSTLSRNLDPLARRGLLALGPEERHRARRVALTEAGLAMLRDAYPRWRQAQCKVAAGVSGLEPTMQQLEAIAAKFA